MPSPVLNREHLIQSLRDFVENRDRSLAAAGRLEVALDALFPEDEAVQDVVLALASYRPGGGDFLYDEHAITKMCRWVLTQLECAPAQDSINAISPRTKDPLN